MSDFEEAAANFRLLAETVSKLKDTAVMEDPEVMKQIDQFAIAMLAYNEKLSALDALCSTPKPTAADRQLLYLVKR